MSRLGDLIVEHGPFVPWTEEGRFRWEAIDMVEVEGLRKELMELRAACPAGSSCWRLDEIETNSDGEVIHHG